MAKPQRSAADKLAGPGPTGLGGVGMNYEKERRPRRIKSRSRGDRHNEAVWIISRSKVTKITNMLSVMVTDRVNCLPVQ